MLEPINKAIGRNLIFLLLGIFTFLPKASYSQNWDIDLLRNINHNRNPNLDGTFQFLSNSETPVLVLVPATLATKYLIKKDSASKKEFILVSASILITGGITTVLKYGIDRTRPGESYSDIIVLTGTGSPSFPSGHTSTSFSVATSLSMAYPKWYVIAPSFLWASGVAYSRMDLGAHYPTDVLAGAIIGSGSAWLSFKLNQWYAKRYYKK
ncbi:MAG: phosphatase PAP2 family protein [Bacteroidia bacterium]|nr:phosphatase PAP2 family protein [Bacteroidia bacterium]MCF8427933.1 phosphatase PAP2 family protein [Bacteroidia bacterium]MCF8447967.1 phosphatase PAP2 family protein [Bacteroidia bacterium]